MRLKNIKLIELSCIFRHKSNSLHKKKVVLFSFLKKYGLTLRNDCIMNNNQDEILLNNFNEYL